LAVALVVLLAGAVTLGPSVVRPVGAAQDAPQPVRLAVSGGAPVGARSAELADKMDTEAAAPVAVTDYVDDGSIYKPVAVDTTVQSGADLLRYYTVKKSDTLSTIATKLKVSTSTIWWANHLKASSKLHVGQVLVAPPVNGLVITVQATDTLAGLAAKYKIRASSILAANRLTDPNLILGQVLILPGAKGAPMPATATSAPARVVHSYRNVSGSWLWPVVGKSYISQGFWSGHLAVDIAAPMGTPIVAAQPGTVIYAGWKDDIGGNQVWISIGNGMYICMYHMSAITVTKGEVVTRGEEVGKIGMTGNATGPHVHFEVWIGYPWKSDSYRVNPLHYI